MALPLNALCLHTLSLSTELGQEQVLNNICQMELTAYLCPLP